MKKLKLNINCHYGCFGSFSERYVPGGYDTLYDFEKMLQDMEYTERLLWRRIELHLVPVAKALLDRPVRGVLTAEFDESRHLTHCPSPR
jgi:hypothetical protein